MNPDRSDLLDLAGQAMSLTATAPAKLNLTLRVEPLRDDGFHPLESLVTLIEFGDQVTVTPRDDDAIVISCNQPGVPTDETNLAFGAASVLSEAAEIDRGVTIHLEKRIPPGMGLGGGSSNAATTLRLLNKLWDAGYKQDELSKLAMLLGSDVPLFLHGPLSVIRGRGEEVEPQAEPMSYAVVLVMPQLHCSTPSVYRAFDEIPSHPPRAELETILSSCSADTLMMQLFNDLEEPAFRVQPLLRQVAIEVRKRIGVPVLVTGSGAGIFRLCGSDEEAQATANKLTGMPGVEVVVTRTQAAARE